MYIYVVCFIVCFSVFQAVRSVVLHKTLQNTLHVKNTVSLRFVDNYQCPPTCRLCAARSDLVVGRDLLQADHAGPVAARAFAGLPGRGFVLQCGYRRASSV